MTDTVCPIICSQICIQFLHIVETKRHRWGNMIGYILKHAPEISVDNRSYRMSRIKEILICYTVPTYIAFEVIFSRTHRNAEYTI